MRKLYFLLSAILVTTVALADVTSVGNSGNSFVPADITITEGDTVDFTPLAASHNVVQVDLATYNANGNTPIGGGFSLPFGGDTLFNLTPGMYYYVCQPHAGGGMKGTIEVLAASGGTTDLLISGVFDGQPTWASSSLFPKGFELYVINDIPDLSVYGVGSANNGGGTDGEELTFPNVPATAGDYIYVASDSTGFYDFFGFSADYVDGAANINGDDAIELFLNGSVVDVFGDIDCDPNASGTTCPAWEYTDGWAYRVDGTGPDGNTFQIGNWTFSGVDELQGATDNGSSPTPFPIGTYSPVLLPAINVDTDSATVNEGDGTVIIANLLIAPQVTVASTVDIVLKSGTGSAADLTGVSFPFTVNVDPSDNSLFVPITLNDDAVYEGDEIIEFVLRNPTGDLTLGNDSLLYLTIEDNELPPDTVVTITNPVINTNEAAGSVNVNIEIGQLSANGTTFTVDLALLSGDAADVDGYTTQTISFTPTGATTQSVTLNITDDLLIEGNETLVFGLTNASAGLTIGALDTAAVTIADNDVATYSIATVTTVDANGELDSLGVEVELTGVVNSPDRGFNSTEFSFQDATGGITAYSTDMSITYDAQVGDEVTVTGTIDNRFGVAIITDISSIVVNSTGNNVDTTTVTGLLEDDESILVRIDDLTLVDVADWTTGSGTSGFDVRAIDGANDTILIRIDRDYDDLYNSTAPIGSFDIVGVVGQFDPTVPLVDGYQILPRFLTDIITEPLPIVDATIDEINNVNANGVADSLNRVYRVTGTINSPDRGFNELEFSMQNGGAGITVLTDDPSFDSYVPVVGAIVEVVGTLTQEVGVVTLQAIQSITELSTGNPVDTAIVTEMNDANESTLIRLNGLTLVNASQWQAVGGSGFTVQALDTNGDTIDIRIDRDYDALYNSSAPSSPFSIVGVSSQFDFSSPFTDGYQIIPRFLTDIIEEGPDAIDELALSSFNLYPNPTIGIVNVSFDYSKQTEATIQLVDVLGNEILSKEIVLANGANNFTLNTNKVATGIYYVVVKTQEGMKVSSLVKE